MKDSRDTHFRYRHTLTPLNPKGPSQRITFSFNGRAGGKNTQMKNLQEGKSLIEFSMAITLKGDEKNDRLFDDDSFQENPPV